MTLSLPGPPNWLAIPPAPGIPRPSRCELEFASLFLDSEIHMYICMYVYMHMYMCIYIQAFLYLLEETMAPGHLHCCVLRALGGISHFAGNFSVQTQSITNLVGCGFLFFKQNEI